MNNTLLGVSIVLFVSELSDLTEKRKGKYHSYF